MASQPGAASSVPFTMTGPGIPVLFTVPNVSFRSHVPHPLIIRRPAVLTSAP